MFTNRSISISIALFAAFTFFLICLYIFQLTAVNALCVTVLASIAQYWSTSLQSWHWNNALFLQEKPRYSLCWQIKPILTGEAFVEKCCRILDQEEAQLAQIRVSLEAAIQSENGCQALLQQTHVSLAHKQLRRDMEHDLLVCTLHSIEEPLLHRVFHGDLKVAI